MEIIKRRTKYTLRRKPTRRASHALYVVAALAFGLLLIVGQMLWNKHAARTGTSKAPVILQQRSSLADGQTLSAYTTVPAKIETAGAAVIPAVAVSTHGYGIAAGSSLAGLSEDQVNARFNDMVTLGVTWVRFDIEWPNVQPDDASQQHWSDYDKVMQAARAHNIKVLAIVDYTPSWAHADGCDSRQCPPKDPAQFAAFVTMAVKRYTPMGVWAWEVWNEPNNHDFWQPKVDAVAYTRLLQASYTAIKKVNPNSLVLTAGLAPQPNDGTNVGRPEFLQQMYDAGAKEYFDAVSDHPYTFPHLPSDTNGQAWAQISDTPVSMRSIMVAHGDAAKKIWITEYGAPTGGPGPSASPANSETVVDTWHVDEALQANMASQAIRLYKSYDWVGPLFWYSLVDSGTTSDTNENFFGLIRHDGSKKPAYYVLQQAIAASR